MKLTTKNCSRKHRLFPVTHKHRCLGGTLVYPVMNNITAKKKKGIFSTGWKARRDHTLDLFRLTPDSRAIVVCLIVS